MTRPQSAPSPAKGSLNNVSPAALPGTGPHGFSHVVSVF